MERRNLVKRKKKAEKPQRQQYFDQPQDQIAYILTDTKETIVTENFYQPISLGILRQYLPKEMFKMKKAVFDRVIYRFLHC